jgi:hypothetical protein
MKRLLDKIPFLRYASLYRRNCFHRPGHYYSPVVSQDDLKSRQSEIWKDRCLRGIDLREEAQNEFLQRLQKMAPRFPFSALPIKSNRYYWENSSFGYSDALVLYCMLSRFHPEKVVEVGSGYSSALILDWTDRNNLNTLLTFIDPDMSRLHGLILPQDIYRMALYQKIVQQVPRTVFTELGEGDILFIDSSHVLKPGSDVGYLLTEILPELKKGVVVHFHDIHYPFNYPKDWVLQKRLNWNEVYAVHNFLLFNDSFQILFFSDYMREKTNCLPGRPGSLWIQKVK